MTKETGGPAFPQPIASNMQDDFKTTCELDNAQSGLTMRDWFAGMAIMGKADYQGAHPDVIVDAYRIADAMLEARKS